MLKPDAARTRLGPSLQIISKYLKYIIIGLALIAVIAVVALGVGETKPKPKATKPVSKCGPYRNDGTMQINGSIFKTEIAKKQQEFTKGLTGRPCIESNQAMLFPFTKPGQYAFWMKDMKFPIDIIWVGADKKVTGIEINVDPSTYHSKNPFFENDSHHLAQYVLELHGNRAQELHVNLGTPVNF